ncbi:MAG: DUF3226 domain-containing protein [Cyanobacteria bacterium P01_G01_bin.38]
MAKAHRNKLLVEGVQDKRIIPELIEANGVLWEFEKKPTVYIEDYSGYENLIDPVEIETQLDSSGLEALGMLVDADEHFQNRWDSVRNACLDSIPDLPNDLPDSGLVHRAPNGVRFGVWIMPNNRSIGMMETFLASMIPDESEGLWQYAKAVVQEARKKNAPFLESHVDKAQIYTWLAWQDEPGRQLHQAVKYKILKPQHSKSKSFVDWFRQLYKL